MTSTTSFSVVPVVVSERGGVRVRFVPVSPLVPAQRRRMAAFAVADALIEHGRVLAARAADRPDCGGIGVLITESVGEQL